MKRLSDFEGEKAVDLWADLFELASEVVTDKRVRKKLSGSKLLIAPVVLKHHKKEVTRILKMLEEPDDEPLNGLNIVERLLYVVEEVYESKILSDFFGWQSQIEQEEPSGSATENTEDEKH